METFRISLSKMIHIYRYMSVGKLINGLIHNLNGPLHSLGIEMDVLNHLLQKQSENSSGSEIIKSVSTRLKRMDEEFEGLTRLIRLSASRMDLLQEDADYLSLNHFLEQGLEFMKANLYFKHEVQTSVRFSSDVTALRTPPENLGLGLTWFIQGLVEELERRRMKTLELETFKGDAGPSVRFILEGGALSEGTAALLQKDVSPTEQDEWSDLGMFLAVQILRNAGTKIDILSQRTETRVTLGFLQGQTER